MLMFTNGDFGPLFKKINKNHSYLPDRYFYRVILKLILHTQPCFLYNGLSKYFY